MGHGEGLVNKELRRLAEHRTASWQRIPLPPADEQLPSRLVAAEIAFWDPLFPISLKAQKAIVGTSSQLVNGGVHLDHKVSGLSNDPDRRLKK
jgi:hypothetical protein